jgi:hypothetical protein
VSDVKGHELTNTTVEVIREQRVKASRVVLAKARNRDDLRLLLDALGLNDRTSKDNS